MRALKVLVTVPVATVSLYSLYHVDKTDVNIPGFINVQASKQHMQLEQVQVLFRHGARTTIKSKQDFDHYSNIDAVVWDKQKLMKVLPHADINYSVKSVDGNDELEPPLSNLVHLGGSIGGDLTTLGQQEAYDFGEWLCKEYIEKHAFISPHYSNKDVYIRSTIAKRAVLTAVGVMAGLYKKENLTENVLIHSSPNKLENMCPNWPACKKLKDRFRYHWFKTDSRLDDVMEEMGLKEGAKSFNYVELFDIIVQRRHHGLFVPECLTRREEEISEFAMETLVKILGSNIDELKDSIGYFLNTICNRIDEAIEGLCPYKLILYPSHDTTVISVLTALGIFDNTWPPFVANIIIELYKGENDERYIRLLHQGNPIILDKESGIEYIPVDKFKKLVEKCRVANWSENCGNNIE